MVGSRLAWRRRFSVANSRDLDASTSGSRDLVTSFGPEPVGCGRSVSRTREEDPDTAQHRRVRTTSRFPPTTYSRLHRVDSGRPTTIGLSKGTRRASEARIILQHAGEPGRPFG